MTARAIYQILNEDKPVSSETISMHDWFLAYAISGINLVVPYVLVFQTGAAPRRDWGNSPPTPHKGYFCKSSKTDEKILEVWGEWRHQPYLNFSLTLSQMVFKERI